MDFIIDEEKIGDLGYLLMEAYKHIDDIVSNIYTGVDAMNQGWKGPSYDSFKVKMQEYKIYLDALSDVVQVYEWVIIEEAASAKSKFITNLQGAIDILEGSDS